MQAVFGDQIDAATKQLFQVNEHSAQIEQASTGLEIDQQIDVALGIRIAADRRTEDAYTARAMTTGDVENFVSL